MVVNRQHIFWVCFVVLSGLSAGLSYKYFDKVAPIVQLSITADRQQIIDNAHVIASDLEWNLTDYQTCVQFASDFDLQSFVELEGGGKQAFINMLQSGAYYPYQWQVRFFKEQEVVEMFVYFSPEGEKIGFHQKVSEQSQGKALSKQEALSLVEKNIESWCPCFKSYTLIEYNSEKRDTGRVDHSFVYERTDLTIAKGLYRFVAVVSGDVITKCKPTIKIPDDFIRRYQEMRSANELLALFGSFIFRLFYLFILALFGMIYLYRRNYLLVKSAALISFFVAILQLFSSFNDYRLWWVSYNTVQSSSTFIMMNCFKNSIEFFALVCIIFLGLVVAEAAGRAMYKDQLQFFKSLSWPVLSSSELFKQVLIGYLSTSFMFGYEIVYTYVTEHYLSWWSPASSTADPNVLASYLPWFGPISISIRAGFLEEVLFRALPLAMIILVTQKSKYKKIWFACMFIVQALVFGACHANYPNQPFFARLVELIIPSFGFGILYYTFGLIPGALCHFVYDAILFALPVFSSGLLFSKCMVIFLIGLPFWIVLSVLIYNRKLHTLPANFYNKAFLGVDYIPAQIKSRKIGQDIPLKNIYAGFILGIIGCCLWMVSYHYFDASWLCITKSQAIECAMDAVKKEYNVDVTDWDVVTIVQDNASSTKNRFVWQVYGKDTYQTIQGPYIQDASWLVRFIKFNRPVEERSEEFKVVVSHGKDDVHPKVVGFKHYVPEHYVEADIAQEQALKIAYKYIKDQLDLAEHQISFISVLSNKLEYRRDWTIVVQDLEFFDFAKDGQARIELAISGDVVTKFKQFIFVPEDWIRTDKAFLINLGVYKILLYFIMFLFILIGCLLGMNNLMVSFYGTTIIRNKALFFFVLVTMMNVNNFCMYVGMFNTAEPFYHQCANILIQLILGSIWQIFFCSLFLTIAAVGCVKSKKINYIQSLLLAISLGLFIAGVVSYLQKYNILLQQQSGNFASAGAWFSGISFCGSMIMKYSLLMSLFVAIFLLIERLNKVSIQVLAIILFCCALQSVGSSQSVLYMILNSLVLSSLVYLIYWLILKYDMTLLPLILATVFIVNGCLPEIIYSSYVGSQLHALGAIGILVAVSFFFYEQSRME